MASLYTREQLTSMKRVDIQRICKDYGVRANMKTDALIDLLLDSINSNMSPLFGRAPPKPQHAQPLRRVSTRSSSRVSSLRSRGASGSSSNSLMGSSGYGTTTSSARSNKSRVTQHRLGVGRPSAAGGSGRRKSTRSSSMAGGKRGASRSVKPPQLTIQEEPETNEVQDSGSAFQNTNGAGSSYLTVPTDSNGDLSSRLAQLEAVIREINPKRSKESHRDVPSQLAWLRASAQQRETEIQNLRGELNVCKAEILALRGEVSRIGYLESQLRFFQETLDQLGAPSMSTPSKGKTPRRVSVPLGESNINTPPSNRFMSLHPVPEIPNAGQDISTLAPAATLNTNGKRTRDSQSDINAVQNIANSENERAKRSRKRARDGTERVVLGEKEVYPKPAQADEAGDSAGTTSGPSSQPPSVGTPPPLHGSEAYIDDAALLDLCQAGNSIPRDMFPQYLQQEETFSPGSALKARNLVPSDSAHRLNLMSSDFEPRRISTAAARPRTPTRSLGHERFRIAVDTNAATTAATGHDSSHQQQQQQQQFNFDESTYGYQYDFSNQANSSNEFAPRRDDGNNGQANQMSPTPMPLAVGYGLAAHTLTDDSPIRGPATTMYGTEIQNDTRFGDFGRDGVASGSSMNFWGNF